MSLNLKQLEAFVKIANNKSFSQTARELYLTQPTVSTYISKLESDLGEKLFARTTKEVELTEAGKKIYLYAREIIELADKIENSFLNAEEKETKQIIVSASSIPGTYLLPAILAEFGRRYPKVEFRINETDSSGVVKDIAEHRADIGFAGTVIGVKSIHFIPFYEDELVIVTPNTDKYRNLAKQTEDFTWLEEETWLMRAKGSGTLKEALKLLETMHIRTDQLRVAARFSNTGAILLSIREGAGIAIISRLAAATAIDREDVLAIPIHSTGSFRKLNMVVSTMYPMSDGCRKMIRVVKDMYNV